MYVHICLYDEFDVQRGMMNWTESNEKKPYISIHLRRVDVCETAKKNNEHTVNCKEVVTRKKNEEYHWMFICCVNVCGCVCERVCFMIEEGKRKRIWIKIGTHWQVGYALIITSRDRQNKWMNYCMIYRWSTAKQWPMSIERVESRLDSIRLIWTTMKFRCLDLTTVIHRANIKTSSSSCSQWMWIVICIEFMSGIEMNRARERKTHSANNLML